MHPQIANSPRDKRSGLSIQGSLKYIEVQLPTGDKTYQVYLKLLLCRLLSVYEVTTVAFIHSLYCKTALADRTSKKQSSRALMMMLTLSRESRCVLEKGVDFLVKFLGFA